MADSHLSGSPEVERACTRLIIDFANHMDLMNYPGVLALFAEDGTLDRAGLVLRGRGEIHGFLAKRPARSVTRHLCTNIRVQARSPDRADGTCYVQFFQSPNEDVRPLPLKAAVAAVAEYHVDFVRQQDDWRIQDFRIRPVFEV